MSVISRIELFHVQAPLPATFRPSWIPGFPQNENRFTLLRMTTDEGVIGHSAGPAMTTEREGLGHLIAPYLLGEDPTDIARIQQRLREMSYLGWRNWWIEGACWDIAGKIANKPVYELLRGAPLDDDKREIEVYASTGEVKSPGERVDEALARYDEGFRSIKLRVHDFDEKTDIAQVEAVAKALGDKMAIGVDANQGWRVAAIANAPLWDLARAKRFADVCKDLGVDWLEEPLPMDSYDDQAALVEYSGVPISGGELHTGALPELKMMIEKRCYDIFQPDAVFTGGIAQTYEVTKLCRQHGLAYTPHTWTNGFGFAMNLQVFLASGFAGEKAIEYGINPPSWIESARDALLVTPFQHQRGKLAAPTGPGLGVEVDKSSLRRFGKRFFNMDKKRLVLFALRDRGLKAAREIDQTRKAREPKSLGQA